MVLFDMAFPTLFPRGKADWLQPRNCSLVWKKWNIEINATHTKSNVETLKEMHVHRNQCMQFLEIPQYTIKVSLKSVYSKINASR